MKLCSRDMVVLMLRVFPKIIGIRVSWQLFKLHACESEQRINWLVARVRVFKNLGRSWFETPPPLDLKKKNNRSENKNKNKNKERKIQVGSVSYGRGLSAI